MKYKQGQTVQRSEAIETVRQLHQQIEKRTGIKIERMPRLDNNYLMEEEKILGKLCVKDILCCQEVVTHFMQ